MKVKLFDQTGKEVGQADLNDAVFKIDINENLIHRALMYQQANARLGLAHTKTRWERRGSTRKIYRQKGTGRARMGANRSPIRKKGWVVFGPRNNTNHSIMMNKKERQKALFSLLSSKVANKEIVVVDDIKLKEIKTKTLADIFTKIPFEKSALLALSERNQVIEKSANNLPNVKTIQTGYLNIADLLKFKTLVLLKSSLEQVNALAK